MKTPEQIDEEFECQKCHALVQLGDGLIPTKYCNLCAQELVEQLEADCAAKNKALESALAGVWDWHYSGKGVTKEYAQAIDKEVKAALSSTAGRDLLERLQKAERELVEERKYSEGLAADICKMEDALGFKQDQCDKDGAFVPTIGPWLERVRDLLAHEGELGDVKERLQAAEKELEQKKVRLARFSLAAIEAKECIKEWAASGLITLSPEDEVLSLLEKALQKDAQ